MVIGNQGGNFSAGANLFLIGMLAQSGQWQRLDDVIKALQEAIMSMRTAPKPVVAAPYQLALGGGCEVSMGVDRMVAHARRRTWAWWSSAWASSPPGVAARRWCASP
ncbi:MAG: hypothetical protein R2873_14460 [Caldilineaceae bacterium]